MERRDSLKGVPEVKVTATTYLDFKLRLPRNWVYALKHFPEKIFGTKIELPIVSFAKTRTKIQKHISSMS